MVTVGPCLLCRAASTPGRQGGPLKAVWLLLGGKKKIPGPGSAKLPERHDDLILKHFIEISNLIAFKIAYNVSVFYRYVNIFYMCKHLC